MQIVPVLQKDLDSETRGKPWGNGTAKPEICPLALSRKESGVPLIWAHTKRHLAFFLLVPTFPTEIGEENS
jgi:hypothetical protein